jgi:hypothetical protein
MSITMEMLEADPEVRKALFQGSDFAVGNQAGLDWFTIDGFARYEVVGHDGGGGAFALYGPQQHVLYVSSEGQAGVIAASLDELMVLLLVCPHWPIVLSGARNRTLNELRRVARILEADVLTADDVENQDRREFVRATLDIALGGDALKALHHAVTVLGKDVIVRAPDGSVCAPLLGPEPLTQKAC